MILKINFNIVLILTPRCLLTEIDSNNKCYYNMHAVNVFIIKKKINLMGFFFSLVITYFSYKNIMLIRCSRIVLRLTPLIDFTRI
jgi:hypothetical protein